MTARFIWRGSQLYARPNFGDRRLRYDRINRRTIDGYRKY